MCIRKKYHEGFALHVALIFALSVYKLDMKFFQEFSHGACFACKENWSLIKQVTENWSQIK